MSDDLNFLDYSDHKWKGIYKINFCVMCDHHTITCPVCENTSCNGGGCKECVEVFRGFNKSKFNVESYLSKEEVEICNKAERLKNLIKKTIEAGFNSINWKHLHETGNLCESDYTVFKKELEFVKNTNA